MNGENVLIPMLYLIYTHSLLKSQLDFFILNENLDKNPFKLSTFNILPGQILLFICEVLATKQKFTWI